MVKQQSIIGSEFEYTILNDDEKTILQAMVLVHTCRINDLHQLLVQSKLLTRRGQSFKSDYVAKLIHKLTKKKLLNHSHDDRKAWEVAHFALKDAVQDTKFRFFFQRAQNKWPLSRTTQEDDFEVFLARDATYLFYCKQEKEFFELCDSFDHGSDNDLAKQILSQIASKIPEDPKWLFSLPEGFFRVIVEQQLQIYPNKSISYANTLRQLEETKRIETVNSTALMHYYIFTGDLEKADEKLKQFDKDTLGFDIFGGTLCFLKGEIQKAIEYYQNGLSNLRSMSEDKDNFFCDIHGIFFLIALIKTKAAVNIEQAEQLAKDGMNIIKKIWGHKKETTKIFEALSCLAQFVKFENADFDVIKLSTSSLQAILWLIKYWINPEAVKSNLLTIKDEFGTLIKTEYHLLSRLYAEILSDALKESCHQVYKNYLQTNQKIPLNFLSLFDKKDYWSRALYQLQNFTRENAVGKQNKRTVFLLDFEEDSDTPIVPLIQKRQKNGGWTKGARLSFYDLTYSSHSIDWMPEKDKNICRMLTSVRDRYASTFRNAVLPMLVGHDQLYLAEYPDIKITLEKSAPEILVEEKENDILVKFITPIEKVGTYDKTGVLVKKETFNQYKLIEVNAEHLNLQKILTDKGLIIPKEGKEQFLDSLKNIMDFVTVYLSMPIDNIPIIECNPALQAQLSPLDQGLRLDLLVRPLGDRGPLKWPGEGEPIMLTVQNGEKVQIKRDLEQERQSVKELISACPSLKKDEENIKTEFPTPAESLELLSEIKTYDKPLQIVCPSGELFKIKSKLSFEHLSLKISSKQDWFEVKGNVKLDSKTLLDMNELLELIDDSSNRLVQLKDGEFLCLTEHFKKQLQQLKRLTKSNGNDLRIHKLGACALDDVICDFDDVELDEKWNEQIEKMQSVKKINPQIPVNLEAKLRPYQEEGYKWLCRLENLGVGACLADDMGLGKTVQAIAVLLKNASKGSSLVVAPTSVCHNWLSEISRFAPTLNPILFSEIDRKNVEKILKKNDVLICSYALLNNSANTLTKISWNVSVLDEAQSIKNATTKRAKAAFELQSKFRIALTGTPIENHLGELWSLFRFLNPGFLGSEKTFFSQFVAPIEKEKSIPTREALKKMIQPFMLRRTKNSVLDSLPPRIEKSLEVDLSTKEAAFYEALRQKAVKNISDTTETAGKKRIKILAEITKLRQACCHPSLVKPEIGIKSSKLSYFENLLQEILENGHKVLVFSQFVRYLKMVCDLLDKQKISYQYLDGATPAKQRREFITNFQNGDGSVFLLSLKAGGVGINLTAADYVILLDPWWNPAVEDQAADRAHRIGQTKPVTIYRLINKNTIEEKIIALHQQKRNLASDLLSGTNMTGKLSEEQLIELMSVV